uniref:Glycerol-3-phosphate acyltransferase n=1 Tax=Bellilinea caldifistulae TaxID=360411 RepID=A0A7C4KZW2_9CHLR
MMQCMLVLIFSYLLGSISSAVLITRLWKKTDIRSLGDGNAGTANVARSVGIVPAAFVALLDIAKGGIPVMIARALFLNEGCAVFCVVAAAVGHNYPIYFRFKGGRGLATSLGGLVALTPASTLITLPVYGLVYFATLGSGILATLVAFPLLIYLNYLRELHPLVIWSPVILAFTTAVCAMPRLLPRWLKLRDKREILVELFPAYSPRPLRSTAPAIFTDSIASLPDELAKREGIHIVPMSLILDGQALPDDGSIDRRAYYQALRTTNTHPTTAAPAPGEFLNRIQAMDGKASAALILTPPADLTQCYNSARLAAEQLADRLKVEVIDCGVAGPAQGLMAILAARLARQGASLDKIKNAVAEARQQIGMIGVLDTLSFIEHSGRVSAIRPLVNAALRVYPVLTLREGQIHLEGMERTRRKAIERMLNWLEKNLQSGGSVLICFHADDSGCAEQIAQTLREKLRPTELYITEMTPVIGAHAGPGLVGVAWWQAAS